MNPTERKSCFLKFLSIHLNKNEGGLLQQQTALLIFTFPPAKVVNRKTRKPIEHTFATRAHRAGVDDKTLQTMGGWKDLATMKNIYVHTQDEDLEIARKILTSSNA